MDAIKYLKTKNRMTEECEIDCGNCPLYREYNCLDEVNPEEAVRIVEQWGKENQKTYRSAIFEMLPNIIKSDDGYPLFTRQVYFGIPSTNKTFQEDWDEEME